jgi:hypothetical protein
MTSRAVQRDLATPAVIAGSVLVFVALELPAMLLYHGGTWWNSSAHGYSFWDNYLCDLLLRHSIDGAPNPIGSRLAATAMIALVVGLVPFWWGARRLMEGSTLGLWASRLGLLSVAGIVAVVLLPSDRFGPVHGLAVVVATVPGLAASLLGVAGLARHERAPRLAAVTGACWLAAATFDFYFYARHLLRGDLGTPFLPAAQKVALACLVVWILAVAARLWPRGTSGRSVATG